MNSEDPPRPRPEDRTREHLANERTFLAWIRTSLSLVGLGFVLARMGLFLAQLAATGPPGPGRSLRAGHEFVVTGLVFLVLGTAMTGWSGWLYHHTLRAIEARDYRPAR